MCSEPAGDRRAVLVFFGSHPHITNGYSKVVYHISQHLARRFQLHIFGFQKFQERDAHSTGRPLCPDIADVYDAWANEDPKHMGFGIAQAKAYVDRVRPDICLVYNDFVVVSQLLAELCASQARLDGHMKIVTYIDQVYTFHRPTFINLLVKQVDHVVAFSPSWQRVLQDHGVPDHQLSWVPHGFCPDAYFPVPAKFARLYYGIHQDDFVILNLNRNQPRKRWDVCMMAMAEVIARASATTTTSTGAGKVKLFIGTTLAQGGAWNLMEIFEHELRKRGLSLQQGLQHIICIDHPQALSDFDINVMYNCADIGLNTAMGEGWGLCNFEQAALGIPQVVPRLGAYPDYLDDDCAMLISPRMHLYADFTSDSVGGETAICHHSDFADAILRYFHDPNLRQEHGRRARARILEGYSWKQVSKKMGDVLAAVIPDPPAAAAAAPATMTSNSGNGPSSGPYVLSSDETTVSNSNSNSNSFSSSTSSPPKQPPKSSSTAGEPLTEPHDSSTTTHPPAAAAAAPGSDTDQHPPEVLPITTSSSPAADSSSSSPAVVAVATTDGDHDVTRTSGGRDQRGAPRKDRSTCCNNRVRALLKAVRTHSSRTPPFPHNSC